MPETLIKPPTDAVYHLTGQVDASQIQEQGLIPPDQKRQPPVRRALDQALDNARPRNIIARGISRQNAVYAHPNFDTLSDKSLTGGHLYFSNKAILEIKTNPQIAMVFDAKLLDAPLRALTHNIDTKLAKRDLRQYWESGLSLADYRKLYDEQGILRPEFHSKKIMPSYGLPEVLIPGPIDPDMLIWAASILKRRATLEGLGIE